MGSLELSHRSYIRGYQQGYDLGVESIRQNVDLLIRRPGVKKNFKDGRCGNR